MKFIFSQFSAFFFFLILIILIPFQPFAQNSILFGDEDPLEVRISTNLDELLKGKNEDSNKQKAEFQYKNKDGKWVTLPVTLKLRGNFRKKNCDFPPIQVNFSNSGKKGHLFVGQKKMKMVTTCTEKEFLLKEFLVYKSYNLITDYSFRVRLLKVKFKNSGKNQKNVSGYAFLIEDIDEVARRCNAKEFETEKNQVKPQKTDFYNNLFMFHFMVGNSDFLFSSSHNMKTIKLNDSKEKLFIPYDFDWCGFVDPAYKNRIQGGLLDIDLKTRSFRGYCMKEDELNMVFNNFRKLKPSFLKLYNDFAYLNKKGKEEIISYVMEFYDFMDNPKEVETWMKAYCEVEE